MSKPYPYARFTMGGTIEGAQSWSIGVGIGLTAVPSEAGLSSLLTSLKAPTTTFWTTFLGTLNMPTVTFSTLRLTAYAAGAAAAGGLAEDSSLPLPGSGTVGVLPPTTCLVATLLTGKPGRSNRGRMYLPITSASLNSHLQLNPGLAATVASGVKDWIASINAATIAALAGTGSIVAGKTAPNKITQIRIDSKMDHQSRRADKIAATDVAVKDL